MVIAKDLIEGKSYSYKGKSYGKLVKKELSTPSGSGFFNQDPYYVLTFENGETLSKDWDEPFTGGAKKKTRKSKRKHRNTRKRT